MRARPRATPAWVAARTRATSRSMAFQNEQCTPAPNREACTARKANPRAGGHRELACCLLASEPVHSLGKTGDPTACSIGVQDTTAAGVCNDGLDLREQCLGGREVTGFNGIGQALDGATHAATVRAVAQALLVVRDDTLDG